METAPKLLNARAVFHEVESGSYSDFFTDAWLNKILCTKTNKNITIKWDSLKKNKVQPNKIK